MTEANDISEIYGDGDDEQREMGLNNATDSDCSVDNLNTSSQRKRRRTRKGMLISC